MLVGGVVNGALCPFSATSVDFNLIECMGPVFNQQVLNVTIHLLLGDFQVTRWVRRSYCDTEGSSGYIGKIVVLSF